jgi:hypothetical protein
VQHVAQISARDAAAVKDNLPAVTEEIKVKVEAGEDTEKAIADTIADQRAEKEKAKAEKERKRKEREAAQAENDRIREEAAAALPQAIKDREQAKAEWRARAKAAENAETAQDRIAELERLNAELNDKVEDQAESIKALESDLEAAQYENKLYREMKVQFEQGGFDKVVADKDEEIRVLQTRVEGESRDKVLWMNKARFWKDEAIKLGWKNGDFTVDIETGEIADA